MKVLLTGGNGFVGSRILARLVSEGIPTVLLLRAGSSRRLIEQWLGAVEIRSGSLDERESLQRAVEGVTHIAHCAGKTKALRREEFEAVNVGGTQRLLEAIGAVSDRGVRLVYLSSLAASHPASADAPAREEDPSRPVSAYGRSKRAAEEVLRAQSRVQHVILRPSGVYGPGDRDFFGLFKAVKAGWCPQFGGGRQALSLVYADDLAAIVVRCLTAEAALGRTYHVAHPEVLTAGTLVREVAICMERRPGLIPLPLWTLIPLSWGGELIGRLRGQPGILGVDRRSELMAEGWVCDSTRLREELGLVCETPLRAGLRKSLAWYRQSGWV